MLASKHIVLGVTGGIAAYKAVEIARLLLKQGATVQVVMTEAAHRFIAPLTFEAVTCRPVAGDLFADETKGVGHIALAKDADLVLVAPATAQSIAKMAHGFADDLLSSLILAFDKPVVVAPSMNGRMYRNPATQRNLAALSDRGYEVIEPETGWLACGEEDVGRLPDPERIVEKVGEILKSRAVLSGKRIVVTAGGTQEAIDPVRFIGNRSSGKMGKELAEALQRQGAEVTLILAGAGVEPPEGVRVIRVTSADEMLTETARFFEESDALVMTAAVSDYRPRAVSTAKIKKTGERLTVDLEQTPDILSELAKRKKDQFVVGFAAETEDLIANARRKLVEKNMDVIVANNVSTPNTGFGSDLLDAAIIPADGPILELGVVEKKELARIVAERIAEAL